MKNKKIRTLKFEPNKINIITGKSNRGKTAIYGIIDYCLFSSTPEIAASKINENVFGYGITFQINDKEYTIVRAAYKTLSQPSSEYYFSSTGEIPKDFPQKNITENEIKAILEPEFSIGRNTTVPFGGTWLTANSKISLRYFLMFNSISEEIIQRKSPFVDKQDSARYREALDRIFDLVMQIDTIDNRLRKERKEELQKEIDRLAKKEESLLGAKNRFDDELSEIVAQAKEYSIIPASDDLNTGLKRLQRFIDEENYETSNDKFSNAEQLRAKAYSINVKLSKLKKFNSEYSRYKKGSVEIADSLKPVEYLLASELVLRGSYLEKIMLSLRTDLDTIKRAVKSKTPIDIQISDLQKEYEKELAAIKEELKLFPNEKKEVSSIAAKYRFLGAIEEKLKLYYNPATNVIADTKNKSTAKQQELSSIQVIDVTEQRSLTIALIEQFVKGYMDIVGEALDNYQNYMPHFDYTKKSLGFRKSFSAEIDFIGSSSNHMFLHLFFTLALHATAITNKSPFIAPFLIIDQPSRPYYGRNRDGEQEDDYNGSDESKILKAFMLLSDFISAPPINKQFQMIIFEHIPKELLSPEKFPDICFIDDFNNDALVPLAMLPELDEINKQDISQNEQDVEPETGQLELEQVDQEQPDSEQKSQ